MVFFDLFVWCVLSALLWLNDTYWVYSTSVRRNLPARNTLVQQAMFSQFEGEDSLLANAFSRKFFRQHASRCCVVCRCGNQVGGQRQQHQLCAEQTAVPRADTEQLINDVRTRRETTTYAASFRIHSVNQNRKRPYFRSPFSFQLVNLVFWCSLIHTHRQMDRVWIFMITEHFRILMCDMMHSVVSDYRMHHIAH